MEKKLFKQDLYYLKNKVVESKIYYPFIYGRRKINSFLYFDAYARQEFVEKVLYHETIKEGKVVKYICDYEIFSDDDDIFSILYCARIDENGGLIECIPNAYSFDVKTNKKIHLTEYTNKTKDQIIALIRKKMYYLQKTNKVRFYSDYYEGAKKYFNENNFYIENKRAVVFYPAMCISPYEEGLIRIHI